MTKRLVVLLVVGCFVLTGCATTSPFAKDYEDIKTAYQNGNITREEAIALANATRDREVQYDCARKQYMASAIQQSFYQMGNSIQQASLQQQAIRNQQIQRLNQLGSFGNPVHVKVDDY